SVLLKPFLDGFDSIYGGLASGYARLLALALRQRAATVSLALTAFTLSMALVPQLPLELIPPMSQGEFKVDFQLAPGARLELTDNTLLDIQLPLLDSDSVAMTYSVAGTGGRLDASAATGGENVGELNVKMAAGSTPEEEAFAMATMRLVLDDIPDAQYTLERPQLFSFATPLEVEIYGAELADIEAVSVRLTDLMLRSDTFRDVESSIRPGYPEIQIEFDQARTAALGLTVPEVANRVVSKIKGDVPTEFTLRDKKIDIRVRVNEEERNSVEDIGNIVINPESERQVRLSTVARIYVGVGPADIQRIGQQRVGVVSANVPGGDLGAAAAEVRELLGEIPRPASVKVEVGGQNEEMEASFRSLQFALVLALIMVYLVMASLFESLLHPFIIMFTIPLAGVGAVLALFVSGTSISVVVFIGLILLVGIVVNNAIVLIDRVNQLRDSGLSKREALMAGASQRLRPILMTTLTTILGLLPMAVGIGEASELRTPMAVTVIGGLMVSTFLTLVVIPVVYDLIDRKILAGDVAENEL
ncbi:MAG: efflux RND transporter permease subunit, partial [Pseudomonadales bacterium]|nr:efflux RND transporter permease subunit [Pseudomonadales bacterium]